MRLTHIIASLAVSITALTLLACSTKPNIVVVTPTPPPGAGVLSQSQPTVRPTLPRLEFQNPTSAPVYSGGEAPYTQPTPTTVKVQRPAQFSKQPAHIGSKDPIAQLVPKTPEFDQETSLKSIYEQIDMQQFAINPALPINTILDPNCDYGIRFSNSIKKQYELRNTGVPTVESNLAVCHPTPVDLYTDNLNNGYHQNGDHYNLNPQIPPPYRYDHYVVNASPIDVITQHPYLFAFKNANLIAKYEPDTQNLRFSANPRDYLKISLKGINKLPAIGAKYPKGLTGAELWLNQPWFTYHSQETTNGYNQYPRQHVPVLIYPSGSLKGVLSDTISDLLQQADDAANTGYAFAQYEPGHGPRATTLEQAIVAPNLRYNQHHFVQWEFLSPYLPIVRVTTYAEHHLPFTAETEYDAPRYLKFYERSGQGSKFTIPKPTGITAVKPTRYATSFVVALQHRWDNFNEPNRLAYYTNKKNGKAPSDSQINRWYANDFMHHSIVGPVVVQVFESEYLQPGIYHKTPAISHWPAPGYISGSAPFAKNAGIIPHRPSSGDPQITIMHYLGSLESGRWWNGLAYGKQYPPRNLFDQSLGSNPFPGEGVIRISLSEITWGREFGTCRVEDWDTDEEYCLFLERKSVDDIIKNENQLLIGYDLP